MAAVLKSPGLEEGHIRCTSQYKVRDAARDRNVDLSSLKVTDSLPTAGTLKASQKGQVGIVKVKLRVVGESTRGWEQLM